MTGVTYRGKHSYRDMGVTVKTISRPVMPPVRTIEEEMKHSDGNLDYSDYLGRLYYSDKLLELEISIAGNDLNSLHKRISDVVNWLAGGYDDLIFDDMPSILWRARPLEIEDIAPQLGRVGKTTVQFRCKPFNKSRYSTRGVPLDSYIPLDTDIPLGFGDESEVEFAKGGRTFNYEYKGSAPCQPVLYIEAPSGCSNFSITCGENTLSYNGAFTMLKLDCENWRATDLSNDGALDVSSGTAGDYLELFPGTNEITITADKGGVVIFDFSPNFFYGGDIW